MQDGGLIHSSSDEIKNVQEFREELINENVLFNRNTFNEEIEL